MGCGGVRGRWGHPGGVLAPPPGGAEGFIGLCACPPWVAVRFRGFSVAALCAGGVGGPRAGCWGSRWVTGPPALRGLLQPCFSPQAGVCWSQATPEPLSALAALPLAPPVWGGLRQSLCKRGFALSLGSAWRVFFLHPDNSNLRLCVQEIIGIHLRGVWEESIALIFVAF